MTSVTKINFLMQAATLFPPNGHANRLLKSHLLTTCREVARTEVNLPKKEFGSTRMCQKCSAIWLDGHLRLEVKSKKVKRPKQRKIVAKLDAGEVLTRSQKSRAKWLKKNSNSRVEITCLLCKHKTKLHLDKTKQHKPEVTAPMEENQLPIKKLIKKKRKDKYAGLNPALVQASTSNSVISIGTSTTVSSTSSSTTLNKPITTKSLSTNPQNPKNKVLPSSNSIKKAKKKVPDVVKAVSKTKQKNTLLQLAHLLKSSNSTNKTPNRLENLLR